MDGAPADGTWLPLRTAWQRAQYGPAGFYAGHWPADHFRTSSQVGGAFADAVLALAREQGAAAIWDIGAGGGELLCALRERDPAIALTGIEVRARPPGLPASVGWARHVPDSMDGLIVASELLDDLPCDVVELDRHGVARVVEVEAGTGRWRLGAAASAAADDWLARWWPLQTTGDRAEVGLERESWWAEVVARTHGRCLVVDYGHTVGSRPVGGTLTGYRRGRRVDPSFDGRTQVTAHVAIDALQARVSGALDRQHGVLDQLAPICRSAVLARTRTDPTHDPAGYLHALASSGRDPEVRDPAGLGTHWWLLTAGRAIRSPRP